MKLYSDILTSEDLDAALPAGVGIRKVTRISTRQRLRCWEVFLEGRTAAHTRKTNSGTHGAGSYYAASYDDHGEWMAVLFDIDPAAIISHWKGRDAFHAGTKGAYARATA